MAQTKRKRRSKHRGNAAGKVEARGRTSRPANLSPAEKKKADRQSARDARMNKPPTWNSALFKAGLMAALLERTAPDYGPARMHPTAGAVLVSAREPLVAFNVELAAPATLQDARRIAALIREGGEEGLPGVRAIGVQLAHAAQVSTNVEDHRAATPADVVAAVRRHAPVAAAELVALAPARALAGFPEDVPMHGRATIEERL